jgi:putative endonuclease
MKARKAPPQAVRRRAHLFGLRAEILAAGLLICKGYRIIERRYVVTGGEIDIIARRRGTIAFVEVKARGDLDEAAGAISETKRRRISRAARVWITRNPWSMSENLRGDAVFVAPGRLPRHLPSAYTLDID